tara:strand:+ start:1077 stop:1940 length:864 start_codon:yes stop_codon:yes gene_type:complete
MTQIRGIYAAGMSIFKDNLSLDVQKTIEHSEKLIQMGCHGVAIFGSTGQAQLISISEKIDLLNKLSTNEHKNKFLVGTGLNSLSDTINLMQISCSLGLNKFLVMPPAYYNYQDEGAINFYTKIINQIPECKIILYNFEKLCGYKFSVKCVEALASRFPKQIIGVKDSTYNLFRELKIKNFSIFPGSELKLLSGLEIGCAGIITATCNATAELSRKVFDDFEKKKTQTANEKLCKVRKVFDQFNLISGLHSFLGKKDKIYKNILPPLNLLNEKDEKKLLEDLSKLDFN